MSRGLALSVSEEIDGITVSLALKVSCESEMLFAEVCEGLSKSRDSEPEDQEQKHRRLLAAMHRLLPSVRRELHQSLLELALESSAKETAVVKQQLCAAKALEASQ